MSREAEQELPAGSSGGRTRTLATCAAVVLAGLLAARFAVEVAPRRPIHATASHDDLHFPKYSDVARLGESRFIWPSD
jgi:hypothetical protein